MGPDCPLLRPDLPDQPQPVAAIAGAAPQSHQNPKEFPVKSDETVAFVFNYCQEFSI
jgi:hypothetical protein